MDYQRIIVIGNVTRDADVKTGEKGEYILLSLATKLRSGVTAYFAVFIAGKKLVEFARDIKKGALLLADGALDISEYKPEGKEAKTDLKIYVDSFRRLSPKGAEEKELQTPEEVFEKKPEE